ncbi:TetR/AcrR family transcriptional regulator [Rhodococcus erythropolis]|uniref:TetR/AcrR family transcriptional regulator n=1 Tax=Rhodococcus erythropolis TaxID=1833 RepID=UPI002949DE50|nr:TetR/AcrR family transcriptional regulator [Rhodococcus erythropolis]MDV6277932.1 TetR/AcrR family transcriptional regulator [Rhodococcus erythropolis]
MNSPIESARTTQSAVTASNQPRIGRPVGSKNSAMQARAVRTREEVVVAAAQLFDGEGYGTTTVNTIIAASGYAKGAVYYHFPSKEAIARQLVADWNLVVDESIREVPVRAAAGTTFDRLTAIFSSLARTIAGDTNVRAGMKLTLEPAIDNGASFARWVDAVSGIVDTAITAGEWADRPATHRLAWNLCSGTVGAAHAAAALPGVVEVAIRIQDVVSAHLKSLAARRTPTPTSAFVGR